MPYTGTIGPGKVVLYARYKPTLFTTKYRVFFGKLQNIFTRKKWTHVALGFFKVEGINLDTKFESKEIQTITLWNPHTTQEYNIYSIEWYTPEEINEALTKTFLEHNSTGYGWIQLINFARRWFWETKWIRKVFGWIPVKIFGKPNDVRKWNVWFVGGTICSELFYRFMQNLNRIRKHSGVEKMLNTWDSNMFHSGDANEFMNGVPEVFVLEYNKPGGVIE